jgi:hypothetical protein
MITTTNKEYAKVLIWVIRHRGNDIATILTISNLPDKEKLRLLNLIVPAAKLEHYIDNYTMSTLIRIKIRDAHLTIEFVIGRYFNKITKLCVEET